MGITVLMSVYKNEKVKYFKEAMDSILNQTRPADEIVLIQDGPIPEPLKNAIEDYAQKCKEIPNYPTFVTYQFKQNVQLGRALAKGVELSSNEYIARMDTDDRSRPDRLEKQEAFMDAHPNLLACGGYIQEFYDDGSYSGIRAVPLGNDIPKKAKFRCPMNHVTVMFRRSKLLEAGNYRHCPGIEDYYLWSCVIPKGYQLDNMTDILVDVRTNENFYDRRGGGDYGKRYLKFRKMQHQAGLTNIFEYWFGLLTTIGMFYTPTWFRRLAYRLVLRKD